VVEWAGMDRVCVDPANGYAVRQRIIHWAPGKPIRCEIMNGDFREVKPGLKMPFLQRVIEFTNIHFAKESTWGKISETLNYQVDEFKFDAVSDEVFNIRVPAGTKVSDSIHEILYTVPDDNSDPLSQALSTGRLHLPRDTFRLWRNILCSLFIIVLTIILVMRFRRSYRLLK
jgi:hypothetical protein